MSKLQPYTTYQPVQYDYVSQLPDGWQLLPNIAIFRERIERGFDNEELLSVTIGKGVIRQSDVDIKKDSSNEDKSKYKLIKVGDIAYNRMRMWQGALGYSEYQGITSPAYVVLKPRMEINQRFFHYMFRTGFYTNYSKRFSYGIVDDQLSLRYVDFKRMYSIVPPLETQNTIVAYLDRKTQQIQEFIAKKERLIELLEEQKERLISNAISRGINQNIELKKTDDIWLKEIPKHWEFKPLKRYVKLNQYSITEKTKPNYLLKYVDIGNVTFNGLLNEPEEITFEKAPSRARRIVKSGDTILSTVRTYLKAIAFFDIANDNLIASTGFAVLSPSKNIIPKYLKYLLSSSYFLHKVNFWAIGVNYPSINNDRLMSIKVAVPPTIEEQKVIIEFIEIELMNFEKTISKAQTEIEKAKEYQESLITQVVTGQLKVPEKSNASLGQNIELGMVAEANGIYRSKH
ncbi:MAG: restriction endonuclease subunit S [Bacteroidetes bacterium]|nr:restriction endonuclease subunit S [Bacteroidota bacterium]